MSVSLQCHRYLEDVGLPFHSVSCQDPTCQMSCEINEWSHGSRSVHKPKPLPLEEDYDCFITKKIKYLTKIMRN